MRAHSVYTYTVSDQLEQMTGPDEASTAMTYDLLGRKTSMNGRTWKRGNISTIRRATW
ncbi:hypothetical protein [Candidatus Amarobacter glycogenicus]|uniref:hypothetical protein n=1 Tax=Candidatus Amarobacter glycogenicus TaxID=3140699 RepID=UPI003136FA9D|nr:hypothetical protein [Dehalococcoidia bacterium]